jgi:hypothetical protein
VTKVKAKCVSFLLAGLATLFSSATAPDKAPRESPLQQEALRLFATAVDMTVENRVVVRPRELENIMGYMEDVKGPALIPLLE